MDACSVPLDDQPNAFRLRLAQWATVDAKHTIHATRLRHRCYTGRLDPDACVSDATRVHRVWLVPHLRGWSYDLTARALEQHLSDRFEIEIAYQDQAHRINVNHADLLVDFWWKGHLHKRYGRRVLKQVSSHRWRQPRFGSLDPMRLVAGHLSKAGGVIVPSLRLQSELAGAAPHVTLCPKGFHPETFGDYGGRRGALSIGWAGAGKAPDKNLATLIAAAQDLRIADECLTQEEMPDFYNALDVITCASDAEGDPRPLIEGMACGCFPVVVDVGIVPELVRHGENGLIVKRTVEAFRSAFAWCRDHIDHVRAAGQRNAQEMLATRTWAAVAPAWGDAFTAAIERDVRGRAPPRDPVARRLAAQRARAIRR